MNLRYSEILKEIQQVLDTSNFDSCEELVRRIVTARVIVLYGAGRVGLAMQGFAKRLRHAGFNSFYLEDCTVPKTGLGDIFIVGSGSGTTPSVVAVAEVAKKNGLDLVLFTANSNSKLADISSCTILLNAPTKLSNASVGSSIQPMTTLFEQSLGITLDAIVLEILAQTDQSIESMKNRHNVIE
jgi:6-phospho-3-hexuloisomerase